MIKQIEFNGVRDSGFHAGPDRKWIMYEVAWTWPQLKHFQKIFGRINPTYLFEIVELFGPNSILSIGGISGILKAPENLLDLKYPGGQPMESSWQFLWEPSPIAKELIDADTNVYVNHPERFFDFATAILKSGVAMKLTNYGTGSVEVTKIPLWRLPGMIKPDLSWQLSKSCQSL